MKLLKAKKGMAIGELIMFVVGVMIAVIILPILSVAISTSLGNFSAGEQALLGIVTLVLVVAIVLGAVGMAGLKKK